MKQFVLYLLIGVFFSACGKEEIKYTIPYAPVNFQLNLNSWDDNLRNSAGFQVYTQGRMATEMTGYSGLLVVNGFNNTLYAFDLCCPYEGQRSVIVKTTNGLTAKCSKCGSVFDIFMGSGRPTSGPATERLQSYRVIPSGDGIRFLVVN